MNDILNLRTLGRRGACCVLASISLASLSSDRAKCFVTSALFSKHSLDLTLEVSVQVFDLNFATGHVNHSIVNHSIMFYTSNTAFQRLN